MNSGMEATGTEMSCLIERAFGAAARPTAFSRSFQKAFAWARLAAITASPAKPASNAGRKDRLRSRPRASSAERPEEISISTCQGHSAGQRRNGVRA